MKHLAANFKKKFMGDKLKDKMWVAIRATTTKESKAIMDDLKNLNEKAWEHLMDF